MGMQRVWVLFGFILISSMTVLFAITLTSETTQKVDVVSSVRGNACFIDKATDKCTDKIGEIVIGHAIVTSYSGTKAELIFIVFGGNIYRSVSITPISMREYTMMDGKKLTILSDVPVESYFGGVYPQIKDVKLLYYTGFKGDFSEILPNGDEIYNTGEVRVFTQEGKNGVKEEIPIAEAYIEYENLTVATTENEGALITSGEIKSLDLTINLPGGISDLYRLTNIYSKTSFEWKP